MNEPKTSLAQILGLARAGASARAWELFTAAGWNARADDPAALTLKGRLLKDQAKMAEGPARATIFRHSADAYAAAAALAPATYPLINAASLALLSEDEVRARDLARQVLELLDSGEHTPDTPYWLTATRAEALLLGRNREGAEKALKEAIKLAPQAWEDHAATLGQFALIAAKQGERSEWLDKFRPPPSLYFSGIIGLEPDEPKLCAQIAAFVDQQRPAFAYGALAAGADILIAEALVSFGTELHVVLPFDIDHFRGVSVVAFGDIWKPRFDRLIEQAASIVTLAVNDPPLHPAIELANDVAMGRAIRNAGLLQSHAIALNVLASGEPVDQRMAAWAEGGHAVTVIETPRSDAVPMAAEQTRDSKHICAIIAIDGEKSRREEASADANAQVHRTKAGLWLIFDTLKEALKYCDDHVKQDPGLRYAIGYAITDRNTPDPALLETSLQRARASQAGVLLADANAAFATILIDNRRHVEEIGELQSVFGSLPVWRIG